MSGPRVSFITHNRYDSVTGCWNWTGALSASGYGFIWHNSKHHLVHRISAHLYLGHSLSSPLLVLHRCDNPSCFNPKHLYIGNQKQNVADAIRGGKHSGAATSCPKGHPYTPANLEPAKLSKGKRSCRICHNNHQRAYKRRKAL